MKKVKIVIIIILIIILLTALVIGVINLKNYIDTRNEILNLNFETPEYKTVGDVVYYDGKEFEDSIIENLVTVADKLKSEYPNRKIVLTEIVKRSHYCRYNFNEIVGEQIIDKSTVIASIDDDIGVKFGTVFKEGNIVSDDINSVKIKREEAIEKIKDYLLENMESYKKWSPGLDMSFTGKGYSIITNDKLEFYQYEGKAAWKFILNSRSYVIMDANNGEILDVFYNYNGPIKID